MKPDAYMPFYFRTFWEAVEELPDWMKIAYIRALTYNWGHKGCVGLTSNEDALRSICRVDESKWAQAYEVLFMSQEFFILGADNLFHQKFQDEIWAESVKQYNAEVKGGKNRWKGVSKKEHSKIASAGAVAMWKKRNAAKKSDASCHASPPSRPASILC